MISQSLSLIKLLQSSSLLWCWKIIRRSTKMILILLSKKCKKKKEIKKLKLLLSSITDSLSTSRSTSTKSLLGFTSPWILTLFIWPQTQRKFLGSKSIWRPPQRNSENSKNLYQLFMMRQSGWLICIHSGLVRRLHGFQICSQCHWSYQCWLT